jgi:hypothetical protein
MGDATTWVTGDNLRGEVTSAERRLTAAGGGVGTRVPDQQWQYGSSPDTQVDRELFLSSLRSGSLHPEGSNASWDHRHG